MQILSLSHLIESKGEEIAIDILSSFCVSRNPDVEHFIHELSVPYEKSNNARTFLFLNDAQDPMGFLSLALNVLTIPEGLTASLKKRIRGFGRLSCDSIPCYLIGQIARFDTSRKEDLTGDDMFSIVMDAAYEAQKLFGGRIVSVDCTDDLVQYYRKRGFILLNKTEDLNQMVYFISDKKGSPLLKKAS